MKYTFKSNKIKVNDPVNGKTLNKASKICDFNFYFNFLLKIHWNKGKMENFIIKSFHYRDFIKIGVSTSSDNEWDTNIKSFALVTMQQLLFV